MSRRDNLAVISAPAAVPVLLLPKKRIKGKIDLSLLPYCSKEYNKQYVYLLQAYSPETKGIIYVYPFRTYETLEKLLESLKEEGLWPLISPNPIRVSSKEFWKEYRRVSYKEPESTVKLVRKYELLKDIAIHVFKIITIDIDSPFEDVYPVWKELQQKLELRQGYRVFKTKSVRFRAYISLDGTRDFKRAKELVAIIYAFFEQRGLNPDPTFVYRLNHPVFYEDFPLYSYELVEDVKGRVAFFGLYRRLKRLQKELGLYTFKGKNLTEEFWGKKAPVKRKEKKECRIIKAPTFVRRLQENTLDNFELWKRAVISLSEKHGSYRYIYVIQPAIGWAKWLKLPKEEVTEFLVGLLGEEKRKDVEKGWRYARELEFKVNDTVKWKGKTREEWEKEVESYIKSREEVTRQELLKEVFSGQVWLLEFILRGMEKEGKVESYFVKAGRGRPRKVYKLVAEVQQCVEAVAVGAEDFSHNNNSLYRRAMGGRLDIDIPGITGSMEYTGKGRESSVKVYGEFDSGSSQRERKGKDEKRERERAPNLTAVAENAEKICSKVALNSATEGNKLERQKELELSPELRKLMQEAEQAQREGNLQRLAELFSKAKWYEVELPELMELYFSDRELGGLIGRVLTLSGRRIDDVVKRVVKVLLLPCQCKLIEKYLPLRPL